MKIIFILNVLFFSFLSCNKDDNSVKTNFRTPPSPSIITNGSVTIYNGKNVRYHTIIQDSTINSSLTTITLVESPLGVTIIDPDTNYKFASTVKTYADQILDQNDIIKAQSIILTHNNTLYPNGLALFSNAKIYCDTAVKNNLFMNNKEEIIPVKNTALINDISYVFHSVLNAEAGENNFNSYVTIPSESALFIGDLADNAVHPYIRNYTPLTGVDELTNWISELKTIQSELSGNYIYIFSKHNGASTDVFNILDLNIIYLTDAQNIILGKQKLASGRKASTSTQVIDELKMYYPNFLLGSVNSALPKTNGENDPGALWF